MEQRVWGFVWLKLGLCSAGLLALCGACSSPGGAAGTSNAGGSGGTSAANGGAAGSTNGGAAGTDSGHAGTSASSGGTNAAAGSAGASACHAERATDPKVVAPTQYDASLIALAAAVVGACLPDDGVDRDASHMWSAQAATGSYYFRTQLQAECLAHSACGCAALEHCLGYTVGVSPSCTAGCVGDVFTACRPAVGTGSVVGNTVDCSSVALSCDPVAACADGAAEPCDDSAFTPTCDANGRPTFCAKGFVQHGPQCSGLGLACAAGACTGNGASCSNTSSGEAGDIVSDGTACSGALLSACVNGKTANLDCAQRGPGFSCQHAAGKYFCGLASECAPGDDYSPSPSNPPQCDGSNVVFCNAGRLEHVACTTLGFTGCEINPSSGHYGCVPTGS